MQNTNFHDSHTTLTPPVQAMEVDERPKRKKRGGAKSSSLSKKIRISRITILIFLLLTLALCPLLPHNTKAPQDELEEAEPEPPKQRQVSKDKPPAEVVDLREVSATKPKNTTTFEEKRDVEEKKKPRRPKPAQPIITELKGWSKSDVTNQSATHLVKYFDTTMCEESLKKIKAMDYPTMRALLDRDDAPAWISADGPSRVVIAMTLENEPIELMQVKDETTLAVPATGNWNMLMLDLCRLLAINDYRNVVMVIVGSGGLTLSRFVAGNHNMCRGSTGITFDPVERYGIDTSQPGGIANVDEGQTKIYQIGSTRNEPRRLSAQIPPMSMLRHGRFPQAYFLEAIRGKSFDTKYMSTTLWLFKKRAAPTIDDKIDDLLE